MPPVHKVVSARGDHFMYILTGNCHGKNFTCFTFTTCDLCVVRFLRTTSSCQHSHVISFYQRYLPVNKFTNLWFYQVKSHYTASSSFHVCIDEVERFGTSISCYGAAMYFLTLLLCLSVKGISSQGKRIIYMSLSYPSRIWFCGSWTAICIERSSKMLNLHKFWAWLLYYRILTKLRLWRILSASCSCCLTRLESAPTISGHSFYLMPACQTQSSLPDFVGHFRATKWHSTLFLIVSLSDAFLAISLHAGVAYIETRFFSSNHWLIHSLTCKLTLPYSCQNPCFASVKQYGYYCC